MATSLLETAVLAELRIAERFAWHALLCLARLGLIVPSSVASMGHPTPLRVVLRPPPHLISNALRLGRRLCYKRNIAHLSCSVPAERRPVGNATATVVEARLGTCTIMDFYFPWRFGGDSATN